MPRKKVPMGKPIKVPDTLSTRDRAIIAAIWRRDAPKEVRGLLDADRTRPPANGK